MHFRPVILQFRSRGEKHLNAVLARVIALHMRKFVLFKILFGEKCTAAEIAIQSIFLVNVVSVDYERCFVHVCLVTVFASIRRFLFLVSQFVLFQTRWSEKDQVATHAVVHAGHVTSLVHFYPVNPQLVFGLEPLVAVLALMHLTRSMDTRDVHIEGAFVWEMQVAPSASHSGS